MNRFLLIARKTRLLSWFFDNPLLVREMRRRMRGRLFSWSLIAYLAALGGVSCVLMFALYPNDLAPTNAREMIQQVGRIGSMLFNGMCVVEGFIALFLAPMITAGLATAEKEKDTFDFLRVTSMRAGTFVAGCLLTTACFLVLIFTCTLPVLGLTFIFGGVSMQEILGFNAKIFLVAMAISAWGVFNSTSFRRSRAVHGLMAFLLVAAVFVGLPILRFFRGWSGGGGAFSVVPNSVWNYFLAGVLVCVTGVFSLAAARRLFEPENRLFNYKQYSIFFIAMLGLMGGAIGYRMGGWGGNPLSTDEFDSLINVYYFLGWILIATAMLLFSTGRIEKGDEVWRMRVEKPYFQRLDERHLVYLLYFALWIGPTLGMVQAWGANTSFQRHVYPSLKLTVPALLVTFAATRFFTALVETRTRATIAVVLVLFVFWGIVPTLGYFVGEIGSAPGSIASTTRMNIAEFMVSSSPISSAYRVWSDDPRSRPQIALAAMLGLSALMLALSLAKPLRRRMAVSYDWRSTPAQEPAAG